MKKINLLNQKFGRLTVISQEKTNFGKTMWKCKCECGNFTIVTSTNLTCERIKSCGCIRKEQIIQRNTTHNERHTHLYEIWKSLKQRCYNPKNHGYHNYGGRGIVVCEEWRNNFQAFSQWAYSNGYSLENHNKDEKSKLTIDRIDVNGNYEPSNCRWVTRKIQANNLRHTKFFTINGETHSLVEWCELLDLDYKNIYSRIYKGWSIEKALETPTPKSFNGTH